MITQELISYIKGELNKGKTREDVRSALLRGGGWSDADLSEAFRTILPVQNPVAALAPSAPAGPILRPAAAPSYPRHLKSAAIFSVIAVLVLGGAYFYRSKLGIAWESFESRLANLPFFGGEEEPEVSQLPAEVQDLPPPPPRVVDCGTADAPDIKDADSPEGNTTLICLGANALACENARGILDDPLFPSVFEIKKDPAGNSCSFQLSYKSDSPLESITGNKLAGQSLSCPLSAVKSFREGDKKALVFGPPSENIPSKYGAEIYFYGTTGVFIEGEFKEDKISGFGCSGSFIRSVIDSYNLLKSKS